MLAVFLKELKLNRRSLLFWLIALTLAAVMGIAEYPFLAKNLDTIMSGINVLPRVILIMFGVDGLTFNTSLDYYVTMYYYYTLLVFFHAVHIGFVLVAKEERDKTAEFLYTKPYNRTEIIIAKLLAGIVNIAVMAVATATITIAGMLPVLNAFDMTPVVLVTCLGMFLSQLVFFALGALCAALFKKGRIASISPYLIVIATYALAVVIRYSGNIDFLNVFTPFQYFIVTEVARTGLDPSYIIIATGVTCMTLAFTALKYKNRELLI
jgi:ABC-2 type transport system permease protein